MNKANVFLLVVVSSLLTYISTATQPAATAGVVQEKWEFAQSKYKYGHDKESLVFVLEKDQRFSSVVRRGNTITYAFGASRPGFPQPVSETFSDLSLKGELNSAMASMLAGLGRQGWMPFQVFRGDEAIGDGLINAPVVYWRRRVQ